MNFGVPKKWFCDEIILWWIGRGIRPAQMNSMVPGAHMGRLLRPKTSFFNYFQEFPISVKIAAGSSLLPGSSSYLLRILRYVGPWGGRQEP